MRVYFYVLISAILRLPAFAPIEKSIEGTIMGKLETAADVRVRISAGRLAFLFKGICKRVIIEVRGLSVSGMKFNMFRIEIDGLRYDPYSTFVKNKARLIDADNCTYHINILDNDLQEFIRLKSPVLSKVNITVDEDWVTIHRPASGLAAILGFKEAFTLRGRLRVNPSKNIFLDIDRVSTFSIKANKRVIDTVTTLINPIIRARDISRLMQAKSVEIIEGKYPTLTLHDIRLDVGEVDLKGRIVFEPRPIETVSDETAAPESTDSLPLSEPVPAAAISSPDEPVQIPETPPEIATVSDDEALEEQQEPPEDELDNRSEAPAPSEDKPATD